VKVLPKSTKRLATTVDLRVRSACEPGVTNARRVSG
jgi:hypothetical protein